MLLCLISCDAIKRRLRISREPVIEWGSKGVEPTIWEYHDWICGRKDDYRIEAK